MNKIYSILLSLFITLSAFSQVTDLGNPKSWELNKKNNVSKIIVPTIDLDKVIKEDIVNDKLTAKPYRIGIPTKINYNINNSGTWINLDNGDRIWLFNISSKKALHLSLNFNDFYIPEGAYLYMYNNDKSDLQGAYTKLNNNKENAFGSWLIKGDNIWVEYFEPKEVKEQGRLNISEIIHIYRLEGKHQFTKNTKVLNSSGDCNQDVDCSIGADFDANKDILKRSVAFLNLGNGYVCSGGLVNNTNNDKTPYFLTANHCYEDVNGNPSNPALYSMRFNWITSGTPRCATTINSANGPTNQVMNGSTLRAKDNRADFMLVELNNAIPTSWDIQFAGWDRSDASPSFEVGIHHPKGDIMKVCRDNTGAIKSTTGGVPIWVIGGNGFGGGEGWELGVTEGGSSGSPLFDQDGRVIGQLWAGAAACTGVDDNDEYDYYGRISASWTGGGTDSTRLSNWLDPNNTGDITTDTLSITANINDFSSLENVIIFPNPTTGIINIDSNYLSLSNFKYSLINILGQEVLKGNLTNQLNISNLEQNIYFLKITNTVNNNHLIKKIVLSK